MLGRSIDFRKDLRRSEPRGDSGGSGWRKEAVKTGGRIHNIRSGVTVLKVGGQILRAKQAENFFLTPPLIGQWGGQNTARNVT